MSTASVSRSVIEALIYKIHQHPLVAYLDLYLGIKHGHIMADDRYVSFQGLFVWCPYILINPL